MHFVATPVRLQRYPKLLTELDREFRRVVPPELLTGDEAQNRRVADHIRAFYFQQRPVDIRNIDSLIDKVKLRISRVAPPELLTGDEAQNRRVADHIRAFYFQQRPVDIRNIDSLIDPPELLTGDEAQNRRVADHIRAFYFQQRPVDIRNIDSLIDKVKLRSLWYCSPETRPRTVGWPTTSGHSTSSSGQSISGTSTALSIIRLVVPLELLTGDEAQNRRVADHIRAFYFQQRPVDIRNIDSLIDGILLPAAARRYQEHRQSHRRKYQITKTVKLRIRRVVPLELLTGDEAQNRRVADHIRAFYFQQRPVDIRNIDSLIDDRRVADHIRAFYFQQRPVDIRNIDSLIDKVKLRISRVVPPELLTGDEAQNRRVADHIRAFYFQQRPVDIRNIDSLIDLFTDVMFLRPLLETLRIQGQTNRTSPTYLYRFAFDGALGLFKRMLGINHPGACHGDEMGYLFYFSRLNYRLDDDSTELAVSKRMVQMWTNFAKTGNPTIGDHEDPIDFKWSPVNDTTHLTYLDINGHFTQKQDPEARRVRLWDWLYENYANATLS
ncbi:carboxylesterase family domain-containing protein [Phthorimaea operculella]|nr:carboxylesterase family domain-containing protein [Phthorimaea operculella]